VLAPLLQAVRAQVALDGPDAAPDIGASRNRPAKAEAQHGAHATRPDEEWPADTESDRGAHVRKKADQWYGRRVVTVHDPCIGSLHRGLSVG